MKDFKTLALLFIFCSLCAMSSLAQEPRDIPVPETTITVEQARANRDRFLSNTDIDESAFTYDYDQLKKFVDFIESQKAKGVDVQYITVYLSQYENGEKTAFIAPLKTDGTPNYDLRVLNHGSVIPPRGNDGRQSGDVKY